MQDMNFVLTISASAVPRTRLCIRLAVSVGIIRSVNPECAMVSYVHE